MDKIRTERRIRVGIDVDGVLRDFNGQIMKLCEEEGCPISRPKEWTFIDDIEINGQTIRNKVWGTEEWLEPLLLDAEVLPFAKKGYDQFINDDLFQVYIVSSQFNGTAQLTDEWLERNGFTKHIMNIYTFDKLEAPCQVLVDDKPSNVRDYQENARDAILHTASYNLHSMLKPKCESLLEAYEQLKEKYDQIEMVV